MGSLYSALNLNFDVTKFGNALDPNQNIVENNYYVRPPITKWQYDAITNKQTANTIYLQNPVSSLVTTIQTGIYGVYQTLNTYNYYLQTYPGTGGSSLLSTIRPLSWNLSNTCNSFFNHTQRLSGIQSTTNTALPTFSSATGLGRSVSPILAKFEGVANNVPVLGSMTSLFVKDDLLVYSAQVASAYTEVLNSISLYTPGIGNPYFISSLSAGAESALADVIARANTFLVQREQHDIAFFGKITELSNNYMQMMNYSGFGDLEAYLIKNYIGTQTLIDKL
jgi:hypothetical protein